VLAVYALRLSAAWIVASPLSRALTAPVATAHPRGDAILFEPGALELVESIRLSAPYLLAELKGSLLVGVFLGWLSLVPAAGLLSALSSRTRTGPAEWARRGVELFPRFTLSFASRLIAQGIVVALAVGAARLLEPRLAAGKSEVRSDLVLVGIVLTALAVAMVLGVLEDLVRVELVRGARFGRALRRASRTLVSNPGRVLAWWVLFALATALLPLAASPLTTLIDVGRAGTGRLIAVTLLHQGVLLGVVTLRALWLSLILELSAEPEPSSAAGGEDLPIDLEVPPGRTIPAHVEAHDPTTEPSP
jgi:hypothetical protein